MSDLFPVTLEEQIAEIEREIGMRQRVYPQQVSAGRLTANRAQRQIAVMEAVLATLRKAVAAR